MSSDRNRAFAEQVARRLRDAGYTALFAGGCVRDLLLGRTPKDYDVATNARPEQVRDLFGHRRTLAVGASFGVVVVVPSKAERESGVEPIEVATFRTEGPYLDGRRPEHIVFATPEEDAKRRDFTINGMFLDPIDGQIHDFVGGRADLAAGVIRAIGEPRERMAEDKLRLLRAVRFAATLGFRLDRSTADAVREMAPQLIVVSAERIAQELRRMLGHPNRRLAVEFCEDLGLLRVVFPELAAVSGTPEWNLTLRTLAGLREAGFESAFAVLWDPLVEAKGTATVQTICRRLRLSKEESAAVVWLCEHRSVLDGIGSQRLSFVKRLAADPRATDLANVIDARCRAAGQVTADVEYFATFLRETPMREIDPPQLLTGGDLISHGLRPGPEFKRLLHAVRDAQLDGTIFTREAALDLVRRLHAAGAADTK